MRLERATGPRDLERQVEQHGQALAVVQQESGNGAPDVERPDGFRLGVSCDRVRRVVAQEWQAGRRGLGSCCKDEVRCFDARTD